MTRAARDARDAVISAAEKVAFLSEADAYPDATHRVEVRETHMAWLFFTDRFVYKLKKPVRYDFLDFSTVEARRRDCELEVELNRRLAQGVYLGTVALTARTGGGLQLGGQGRTVDWLVKMHRLPETRMLDNALRAKTASIEDARRVARLLASFYQYALVVPVTTTEYRNQFARDLIIHEKELGKAEYGLTRGAVDRVSERQRRFVAEQGHLLEDRARMRRIVDAHGDLRPQHICLLQKPAIIDCLEFNRAFRILDPLDELAYLAMECERLCNPEFGDRILTQYQIATGDSAPEVLIYFYKAFRACVRAKIAVWHTLDQNVSDHGYWLQRAQTYLDLAERYTEQWQ